MEQMLRSVVSKPGSADHATNIAPERLQDDTPQVISSNLTTGANHNQRGGMSTTHTIGANVSANNVQYNDTVDGMGIITFADEVASGYFGLHHCLFCVSISDLGQARLQIRPSSIISATQSERQGSPANPLLQQQIAQPQTTSLDHTHHAQLQEKDTIQLLGLVPSIALRYLRTRRSSTWSTYSSLAQECSSRISTRDLCSMALSRLD